MKYALKYIQAHPYLDWSKTNRGYEAWHYLTGILYNYTIDIDQAQVFTDLNEVFKVKAQQERIRSLLDSWYYVVEVI